MNLFFNKFLSNIPSFTSAHQQNYERPYSTALQGPDKDTFVKNSIASSPCFTAKSKNSRTKEGDCLKELDNITCPYSGVKMISGSKMDRLEKQLEECNSISERMELLEKYTPCMQKLEKQMFSVFKGYQINHPDGSLNECLQLLKPDCLAELKIEELKVLDNIDEISNKLDAKTALAVRNVTTNARKTILEDKEDNIFKRKDILLNLLNVTQDYDDKAIIDEMWNTAQKLPRSTTNINAFVVKYANRCPHEIAARLLRPSVASIEHITPKSTFKNGQNPEDHTLANFMLVSRDWNSDRSSTPLPVYIIEHPEIPKYSQMHVNDIIKAIHKGKFVNHDWYPYILKEKLYNESEGLIDINLNKYKITKEEAFKNAPKDIIDKYNDLVEKNKNTATADV